MILEGRLIGKEDTEKLEKDQRGNGGVPKYIRYLYKIVNQSIKNRS